MRSFVERFYAALLFAYPPDLRRTHGVSMRQCAREASRAVTPASDAEIF